MEDLLDFEKHKHQDAFSVIADAIKRTYNDEKMIPKDLPRIIGKIIDDGFLDGVLEKQRELIRHNENRLADLNSSIRGKGDLHSRLVCEIRSLECRVERLREAEDKFEKEIENETDPLLLGAKKAYHFIQQKTSSDALAAKAFNSYLLCHGKDPKQTTE